MLELHHDGRFYRRVDRQPVQRVAGMNEGDPRPWTVRVPQRDTVSVRDHRSRQARGLCEVVRPAPSRDRGRERSVFLDLKDDGCLVLVEKRADPAEVAAPGPDEVIGGSGNPAKWSWWRTGRTPHRPPRAEGDPGDR